MKTLMTDCAEVTVGLPRMAHNHVVAGSIPARAITVQPITDGPRIAQDADGDVMGVIILAIMVVLIANMFQK